VIVVIVVTVVMVGCGYLPTALQPSSSTNEDPDRGSIRIAIGQLLDYRRFLKRSAASDLAVLTILPPSPSHIELLEELQITALWYTDEKCQRIGGAGPAWPVIRNLQSRIGRSG